MGDEAKGPQDLETSLKMVARRIEQARKAPCSPPGHHEVVETLADLEDVLAQLGRSVQELPRIISATLRADVLGLIQMYAQDAVKEALLRSIPPDKLPPASPPAGGDPTVPALPGPWGAVLATVNRVPMAASICAVAGFLTFSVFVLAKGLKIL